MFKRKQKRISQLIQSTDKIYIERMTYEVWNKHFRNNNFDEYNNAFMPYNLLEYLSTVLGGIRNNILLENSADTKIYQTVIDAEYYDWLGDREDTEENLMEYINWYNDTKSTEEIVKKTENNKFNISVFNHGFLITGKFAQNKINSNLSKDTQEKIRDYIKEIIDDSDFDIYVAPYFLTIADYMENLTRLNDLANVYFNEGKILKYGKYETSETDSSNLQEVIVIPFSVSEIHKDCFVTTKELKEYISCTSPKTGRSLGKIMTDPIGAYDLFLTPQGNEVENAKKWFKDSDAISALKKDLEGRFVIESVINCFIPAFGVREFLMYLVKFFRKQAKSTSLQEETLKRKHVDTFAD